MATEREHVGRPAKPPSSGTQGRSPVTLPGSGGWATALAALRPSGLRLFLVAAAALLAASAGHAAPSGEPPRPVKLGLRSGTPTSEGPGLTRVPIHLILSVKRGFHIFAPSAINADFDTVSVTITASAGHLEPPIFPAGVTRTLAAIGAQADLLEGDVSVESVLHLPVIAPGKVHVAAVVHYQACSDLMCYLPIDDTAGIDVMPTGLSGGAPGSSPGGPGSGSSVSPPGGGPTASAAPTPDTGVSLLGVHSPVVPAASTSPGSAAMSGSTTANAPPRHGPPQVGTVAPPAGAHPSAVAGETRPAGATGSGPPSAPGRTTAAANDSGADTVAQWFRTQGTFAALVLIYLAGLGLNLTPCIYPMIPVTISFFGAQSSGRMGRSFALALAYVLGMSVTYSALGVIAALTGRALGTVVGSPPFLVFTALVFVALALSFLGFYEIRAPGFIADRASAREGILGAGLMGLLVGFVAAPCLAPAILGLMLYVSQVGSVLWGFLLFFVLSLGLGTPFLVLGTASGLIAALPGSGSWMDTVKHAFGAILMGMAVYYASPVLADPLTRVLAGLILLGVGVSAGAFDGPPPAGDGVDAAYWGRVARRTVAVGALVGGAAAIWTAVVWGPAGGGGGGDAGGWAAPREAARGAKASIQWTADEGAVGEARAAGRPVMLDFTDSRRCVACVELEQKTYPDPAVVAESCRFTAVKIDAWTHPRARELAAEYHVLGYPTVLFFDGRGVAVPEATVAGFVPPDEFLARLRRVR